MREPSAGLQRLELGDGRRDGLLYIPKSYTPDRSAPLILTLHGAGATGEHALPPLLDFADEAGLILLAPDSRGRTWDLIERNAIGPDVSFIDMALEMAFERYSIDPARVAIEGFSDGASYALSLGLANAGLFSRIIAFSPGFMAPPFIPENERPPEIFISHGVDDDVLPIDRCGRKVAHSLKKAGYSVRYLEFSGGHVVPLDVAGQAVGWFEQ